MSSSDPNTRILALEKRIAQLEKIHQRVFEMKKTIKGKVDRQKAQSLVKKLKNQ